MYSLIDYGWMTLDEIRMQAYLKALERAVQPGAVVVDIGAGSGIFSLMACRYGARKVYAIEPDNSIHVARSLAAANGCEDRIEFIQDISTRVRLPEQADVIVSDLRGTLPLHDRHIPSIIHARKTFLKPGGKLLPHRDTLWACLVHSPKLYERHVKPFDNNPFDLNLEVARQFAINTWRGGQDFVAEPLTEPQCWGELDYRTIESPSIKATLRWMPEEDVQEAHGLLLWFDAEVEEGLKYSNAPNQPGLVYGRAFFPFLKPLDAHTGDELTVKLEAIFQESDYIWRWDTEVIEKGTSRKVATSFRQSTFFGVPLSPESLKKRTATYRAQLSDEGRTAKAVLDAFDGSTPLAQLAQQLVAKFPERFPESRSALNYVCELSERYGR